jgi:serine/threonine protein kinase
LLVAACCQNVAGDLLGAGSFGSVYKGRWNNTDVAVKVIQHDAAQAEEVENEVLLMMGLQHECIVAAYHYIAYAKTAAAPESLAGALSRLSSSSSNTPVHQRILDGSVCSDQLLSCSSNRELSARKGSGVKHLAESHLIMEYCDYGTLAEAVVKLRKQQQDNKPRADQDLLAPFLPLLQDAARGLQAIHSRNVVHGDLVS